jgi:hypothetical protein
MLEYTYDERGKEQISGINNDLFAGLNLNFNDRQSTNLYPGGDRLNLTHIRNRSGCTRQDWHLGFFHNPPRPWLISHQFNIAHPGSNESKTRPLTRLSKICILGQKPVAGVHRISPKGQSGTHDGRDIQVTSSGRRRPDAHTLVSEPDM